MEVLENVGTGVLYVAIVVSFAVSALRLAQYLKARKDTDETGQSDE